MLFLKLTVVPLALLALGLAERRLGPRLAGWLAGIPVVAGPLLVFVTLAHGRIFGAHAALGAWLGTVPWLGFANVYVLAARHMAWGWCTVLAFLAWLILAYLATLAEQGPAWLQILPLLAFLAAMLAYPRGTPAPGGQAGGWWSLPARMLAGAILTLLITQTSGILGPGWSGTLAVFPVMGSIITISNHIQRGHDAARDAAAGMSMGQSSVGALAFVLHALLPHLPLAPACIMALAAATGAHALTFLLVRRLHMARVPA
jgi:hypothetical protein